MIKQIAYLKPLLFLLALCLYCQNLSAQQAATVKSFIQTTDHIPVGDRRNDLNGTPCALVKVQVVDDIERVEGNKIGDIINHGVEKWVYMCKGSRNMRIHFKNHLPIRVTFRDYKINGLESNRVYELVVNTPNQPGPAPVQVQGSNLQMRVSPSNATITIWGDNYQRQSHRPQDDGTLRVYLPYGRYHYLAKADGYNDMEGSVFVNDENKWEDIRLQAITGTLSVECNTQGVDFYLNNELLLKNKSDTHWIGPIEPGEYHIEARKKDYITKSQRITITANQIAYANFGQLLTKSEQKRIEQQKLKEEKDKAKTEADALAKKKEKEIAKVKEEQKKQKAKEEALRKEEHAKQAKIKREERIKKLEIKDKKSVVLGVTAGYNMAAAAFSNDYDGETESVSSFHAGLTIDFRLSKSFYLASGLLFSIKGYEYENRRNDIREKGDAQYIDIPIQASIRFPLGHQTKLQLNAGPYIALCVGGTVKDDYYNSLYDESFSSAYSGFDYGLQGGIGADINYHFHIGVNYQLGMASSYQNRNLMIGIGYRF